MAQVAHSANLPLMIDNTFASPYLCRPIEHGADIVVHSATKFIGGHGTSIGGVIVDSGRFPLGPRCVPPDDRAKQGIPRHSFSRNVRRLRIHHEGARGRVARFRSSPEPFQFIFISAGPGDIEAAHGVSLAQRAGSGELSVKTSRRRLGKLSGAGIQPVSRARKKVLCRAARGAILSFGIRGGLQAGRRFIENLKVVSHLANVGDAKSLPVIHPASTTHQQLSDEEKKICGISDDMIRLSVGIEEIEDILWDLDRALSAGANV